MADKKAKPEYDYVVPLIRGGFDLIAVREYKFCQGRNWRFDYAIVSIKLAIEIEGGIFIQGGHSRGSGMMKDIEKYNNAAILGWRILRYSPKQIQDRLYIDNIREFLYYENREFKLTS